MPTKIEQYGSAELKDYKYVFTLEGHQLYREQFADFIGKGKKKINLKFTTEEIKNPKSWEQLKYLRGPVLQCALSGFREIGYHEFCNIDQVLTKFKTWWFTEKIMNENQPKSLADASTEEVFDFTEKIREFCDVNLNTYIMTPEEWKEHIKMEIESQKST